jgi:hypothetical protein
MKRILFFVVMALLSITTNAQSVVSVEGGKYPVYCEVVGYNTWGYGKVKVRLDMGRKQPNKEGYESIYDGEKKRKFNTMMEVLDYMAKRGWTVHSSYIVTEGISKQNVLHFLMEKKVTNDSQISEGLELGNED